MKSINFVVIGVSGSGKSSVAKNLSLHSCLNYVDADKFHSHKNKIKMKTGLALTEKDRMPWFKRITKYLKYKNNWVLACSALKCSHRNILKRKLRKVTFIWLDTSYVNIVKRIEKRKNHFFSSKLIQSQFDTFEVPKDCFRIKTNKPLYVVKLIARNFVKKKTQNL